MDDFICETNEPINRQAGNIEQADLEKRTADQCRAAITVPQQQPA